ncbi:hypothetical protein BGW36DRAFT_423632 [Talaromyces proteolyticus]|uniref:Uncharacterized protein n=1 Tax=Talaromyces proteolyticus TaxID=1131652 RepID=A0AAD4Q5D7_9EURO|nr:uncharacterized protein BGW36DRAFT_423632 [Talaromyces proteolyticus]KAH8704106.1 hypothetical protein BGW36DRAFT_423632 [Talaromyces proteolyticus]
MSTQNTTPKTPLIPSTSRSDNTTSRQPSNFAIGTVQALAWLRVVAGGAALVAPSFTAKLFFLPGVTPGSLASYQLRLFGIRDAVIGELLYTVRPKFPSAASPASQTESDWERDRKELRRMLWANVATDALDVVVTGTALAAGIIPRSAAVAVGGGATVFLLMGLVGLKTI